MYLATPTHSSSSSAGSSTYYHHHYYSMSDKEGRSGSRPPPAQNLRFVVANDPDQFRDRSIMRSNRSHVMHNHLSEKRASGSISPSRASSSARGGIRRNISTTRSRHGSPSLQAESSRDEQLGTDQVMSSQDAINIYRRTADPRAKATAGRKTSSKGSSKAATTLHGRRGSQARVVPATPSSEASTSSPDTLFIAPYQGEMLLSQDSHPGVAAQDYITQSPQVMSPGAQVIMPEPFRNLVLEVLQSTGVAFDMSNYSFDEKLIFSGMLSLASPDITFSPPDSPSATASDLMSNEAVQVLQYSFGDPQSRISDVTVIAVLFLILRATLQGDIGSAEVHKRGLESILNVRYSVQDLSQAMRMPLMMVPALLAVSLEERVHGRCLDFWRRQPDYVFHDPLRTPQSPLLFQPATFAHNYSSTLCSPTTYTLLRMSCELTGLAHESARVQRYARHDPSILVNEEYLERQKVMIERTYALHDAIVDSCHRATAEAEADDVLYACRAAALVYCTSVAKHVPFAYAAETLATAAHSVISLPGLCAALQRTDLSGCWGTMAGALLWASLIGAVAVEKTSPSRSWLMSIAARCVLTMAVEHEDAALESVGSLMKVMELWTEDDEARPLE